MCIQFLDDGNVLCLYVSLVRVPINIVYVARNRSKIEKRSQKQSYFFWRGEFTHKGPNPKETVLGSSLNGDLFCS